MLDKLDKPLSRPRAYRRPSRRVFWVRRAVVGGIVMFLVLTSWSLIGALTAPGDDGTSVKLAEWARDHYLGPVVTLAENVQYDLNPPAVGGAPDISQLAAAAAEQTRPGRTTQNSTSGIVLQPPIVPPVAPALAGEGVYVPAVNSAGGPLVQQTFVRPDTVHTSYLTGVAWMSHNLRFVLHPGFQDPGTAGMSEPDMIAGRQLSGLVATFNGGFKMQDAQGGYYDRGNTVGNLTNGAASFVIYKDGHATVGSWGHDVSMTPDVAFVRQNLKLLVAGGRVAPNLEANVQSTWGTTLGGAAAVWRSGLGVTAHGDLVYVMGDAMSVSDLADILHRSGAVNAMQLDINQAWTSFMYYTHYTTTPVPHKLGRFQRPVDRYFSPTSRDFVAVYVP